MICTCTHENCYFVFYVNGTTVPDRCPDCGNPSVRPSTAKEIAWFCREHGHFVKAG